MSQYREVLAKRVEQLYWAMGGQGSYAWCLETVKQADVKVRQAVFGIGDK